MVASRASRALVSVAVAVAIAMPGTAGAHALPGRVPSAATSTLTFAVEADPHMDEQSYPAVFRATLARIAASKPAFLVDLGDIFMVDKLADPSDASMRARYELMKDYYASLGPSIPLHLVMGNHDGEAGWDRLNAKSLRREYFPRETLPLNYHAFTAQNALFVVLDPYSYTARKPGQDGWLWTLGKTQYDWLASTLQRSKALHKFVFIHQLVGGDPQGRGGVEYAHLFEWGGRSLDGSDDFATKRPGWAKPIHQLLVDNGVEAVFKGHDHLYAAQMLDGIRYQTVPQPSHPGDKAPQAADYGYQSGSIVGGSGFLLVTVRGRSTRVTFVRSTGAKAAAYTMSR
jgi:hypothetical protein